MLLLNRNTIPWIYENIITFICIWYTTYIVYCIACQNMGKAGWIFTQSLKVNDLHCSLLKYQFNALSSTTYICVLYNVLWYSKAPVLLCASCTILLQGGHVKLVTTKVRFVGFFLPLSFIWIISCILILLKAFEVVTCLWLYGWRQKHQSNWKHIEST